MSMPVTQMPNKTAKPVVAGIFNIVIGSFCILGVLGLLIAAALVTPVTATGDFPIKVSILLAIIAVPLAALGALSIAGGIFDLQRRQWGWALAGSIAAAFASTALGIAAIVLTAVSKDEFSR